MRLTRLLALTATIVAPLAFAQGSFNGPGRYQIRNIETQKPLDLSGDRLIQNSPNNSRSQVWDIQQAAPDYWYIRNGASGCGLEFDQDRNGSPVRCTNSGNPNQQWRLEPVGNGAFLIISRFRKPLDLPDGSRRDGVPLQIYDRNAEGNQRFFVERAGGDIGRIGPVDRGGQSERVREPEIVRVPERDRGRDRPAGDGPRGTYYDDRDQMWKVRGDGVCFYRDTDFRGEALCARSGEDLADVRREGGGVFLSMKLFGAARGVEVFERAAFRGQVIRLGRDESNLRRIRAGWAGSVGEAIGSFRVN
jgi:hypothetical protein